MFKVSVIINCYNGSKYLQKTLDSLINQSYQDWELIFWDNLSNDNSKEIFKKYNDKRFKYFLADKHTVLYEARNLAIRLKNDKDFYIECSSNAKNNFKNLYSEEKFLKYFNNLKLN